MTGIAQVGIFAPQSGCSALRPLVPRHPGQVQPTGQGGGPFESCRHPNNDSFLMALLMSTPAIGTAGYLDFGSLHQEQRLRAVDGAQFVW